MKEAPEIAIPPLSSFNVFNVELPKKDRNELSWSEDLLLTFNEFAKLAKMAAHEKISPDIISKTAQYIFSTVVMPWIMYGNFFDNYAAFPVLGFVHKERDVLKLDVDVCDAALVLASNFGRVYIGLNKEGQKNKAEAALVGHYIARQFYDAASFKQESCFSNPIASTMIETCIDGTTYITNKRLRPLQVNNIVKAAILKCRALLAAEEGKFVP